jgi:hypothetical protein
MICYFFNFSNIRKAAVLVVAAALLWTLPGCSKSQDSSKKSDSVPAKSVKSADTPTREVWDVCFTQGARVGYVQTTYSRTTVGGKPAVRIDGVTQIALKRFGEDTQQQIHYNSTETPTGRLIRFESEMQMGASPLRTTGQVVGRRLVMESVSQGKVTTGAIDWSADYGGFFAMEQSLLGKPMQPGERRTLHTLIAGFNQVATLEMVAGKWEQTLLLHGTYNLLHIDTMAIFPDGNKMEQTVWIDRTGDTIKTRSPAMAMESYRVSKEEALEKSDGAKFDIGLNTTVKLPKPLPNGHDTKRIVYRVRLEGSDPAAVFVSGSTQQIKSIDANTADVTVYSVRPDRPGNPDAPADLPTADDRVPNNWIQSDNAKVIALAREAADGETDSWKTAVKLEQFVHNFIKLKDYSQAFASAAEVIDTREGDCTEHAVLLAALCRAQGIPARVAIGLVIMPNGKEFGYHMWTEVFIDKQWIPIDATLARGGIGAAHLKLAHSNLKGASAYGSFLPVVQVVGRLKIEVMEGE